MITLGPKGQVRTRTRSPQHRPCCPTPPPAYPKVGPQSPAGWSPAGMEAAAWWAEQLQALRSSPQGCYCWASQPTPV